MPAEEEIIKMMKQIQTSLHDQVSAAKADAERAAKDTEASLEISATLEKSINDITSGKIEVERQLKMHYDLLELIHQQINKHQRRIRRTEISAGIVALCWYLSILIISGIIGYPTNEQLQSELVEQLSKLLNLNKDCAHKLTQATSIEQLDSIALQTIDTYMAIQSKVIDLAQP